MYTRLIYKITLLVCIFFSYPAVADGTLESVHHKENIAQFELKAIDGKIHRLIDYQGKVVLVNFWASWCPPCLEEIPSMQRLEKSFQNRPFEIVAINVAEQKKKVIYQSRHFNKTFKVLLDLESKTFKQWQAKILPTSYIVDKKGYIRYFAQGPIDWDTDEVSTTIEKLLIE